MRVSLKNIGRKCISAAAAAVLLGGLVAVVGNSAIVPTDAASAADMNGFNAGNIIDDSRFFNGNVMSASDVQAFLNGKVSSCRSGYTCLKDYAQATPSIDANPMCNAYVGASNESAATIIAKVGQACGISQKVILVTLQKEQGLVTDTWPTASQYSSAMGALCPDTAPCDTGAAGFFKQVYTGAYLFKRYTQPAGTGANTDYSSRFDLMYPVGQTSNILYNPNSSCGTQSVTVQNQATHVLYVYTPYTPNSAALASSYGIGDGCSSYGNRNFYSYFIDWFGSVRGYDYAIGQYFTSYYSSNSATLGYPVGAMICGEPNNGCSQEFANGVVSGSYSTSAAGVYISTFLSTWSNWGRMYGQFGYPTSEVTADLGGGYSRQAFQGGWILTSPTGLRFVWDQARQLWSNWGREYGPFGWPTSNQYCAGSGVCFQDFSSAEFVTANNATYAVPTIVQTLWSNWGREYGPLGTPSSSPSANPTSGNYTLTFTGGTVTVTNGAAAITSFTDPWYNTVLVNGGFTGGWLGSSTNAKSCTLGSGACYQAYTGGWVVQSSAGVSALPTVVQTLWSNWGREYGPLGLPTGSPSATPANNNTYTQVFQGGVITVTNGVAAITSFVDPWYNTILTNSTWLGSATGNKSCTLGSGACYQAYAGGWVVQSNAGTYAVPTSVLTTWGNWGREYGPLGFPTSNPITDLGNNTYTRQGFQRGWILGSPTGTHVLPSTAQAVWSNWGREYGPFGWPTSNQYCAGSGVCFQDFSSAEFVTANNATYAVPTIVQTLWSNWGREYGPLGTPSSSPSANPTSGNYTLTFTGGTVTVTNGAAAITSFTDPWYNTVLVNGGFTGGWLGSSTNAKSCTLGSGACYQAYTGGWVVQSSAGVSALPTVVQTLWSNWGREYGPLGLPTGSPSATPANNNTYTQVFQGGVITVTNGVAAITSFVDPWYNTILTNSTWLGSATGNKSCTLGSGACYQAYAGGWVVQSNAGTYAVPTSVLTTWGNWGREYGPLGFPTSNPSAAPGNTGTYTQSFQNGIITVTNGSGMRTQ